MSEQPTISFNIPASDKELIKDILNLINGSETQGRETTVNESSAKTTGKKAASSKSAPAKKETPEPEYMDFEEFKEAAKKAKADHGEAFVISVMEDTGFSKKATLGATVKSIPEKSRSLIASLWALGEQEADLEDDEAEEDLDEDDFGDEEDEAEVTADSVKLALKAYAKENSKADAQAIMAKFKVKVLADVDKLKEDKLAALMKELV